MFGFFKRRSQFEKDIAGAMKLDAQIQKVQEQQTRPSKQKLLHAYMYEYQQSLRAKGIPDTEIKPLLRQAEAMFETAQGQKMLDDMYNDLMTKRT